METVPTIASSLVHSPRRALQSLSPNKSLTPRPYRGAQKQPQLLSPFKIGGPQSRPASAVPSADTTRVESPPLLATSKKRSYDDALGPDEHNNPRPMAHNSSQTHASFSSLINYDSPPAPPPSSPPALSPASSASTAVDAPRVPPTPVPAPAQTPLQRAEVLRLRLRMAMFRVRTNQLRVPLDGLLVPGPPSPDLAVQRQLHGKEGQRQEEGSPGREESGPPRTPLRARHTAAAGDASTPGGSERRVGGLLAA
jgi:hypothetical protein